MAFLNFCPYLGEKSRRAKEFESRMSGHLQTQAGRPHGDDPFSPHPRARRSLPGENKARSFAHGTVHRKSIGNRFRLMCDPVGER